MIRFIDLTGQIYFDQDEGNPIKVFAFFDTVRNQFFNFEGFETWDNIEDFKQDFSIFSTSYPIERFLKLIPDNFFKKEM